MRIYNRYLLTLAAAFALVTAVLALWRFDDLRVYITVYVLVDLIVTTLFISLNPRARRALGVVAFTVFAGFMVIVTAEVVRILSR